MQTEMGCYILFVEIVLLETIIIIISLKISTYKVTVLITGVSVANWYTIWQGLSTAYCNRCSVELGINYGLVLVLVVKFMIKHKHQA